MKTICSQLPRTILLLILAATIIFAQDKKEPQISSAEADAAKKVQAAKDIPAKFKAAEEFMKKYAKGAARPKVAIYMSGVIADVTDGKQRLGYIENYNKIFNDDSEHELIVAAHVDALAITDKVDEAFALSPKAFEKSSDNVMLLTQLTIKGTQQVQRQQMQNADATKNYGKQAIYLMENNKKPEWMKDEDWQKFKTQYLGELYQSIGLVAYANKDAVESKTYFVKSTEANSANPFSFVMLGELANMDYQTLAQEYNVASGAAKDAALKKAEAQLDQVIDYYAHAVGLMLGKPQYQAMHDQVLPSLQEYYKYRKGSTNGLQELINKYKQ